MVRIRRRMSRKEDPVPAELRSLVEQAMAACQRYSQTGEVAALDAEVPSSVRAAQRWVRDTTNHEKAAYIGAPWHRGGCSRGRRWLDPFP